MATRSDAALLLSLVSADRNLDGSADDYAEQHDALLDELSALLTRLGQQ